ncbi:hypothetical protein EVAR_42371_1 [Eumeta japonica]|uniref:Uncharacterized protein n=1 Tax=Eumeta variegata TaxID=151549 RepID=A0A4C1YGC8_EUMVA|nr:hypothetical protein EVAR_42371_1 [Eumeta japonica]
MERSLPPIKSQSSHQCHIDLLGADMTFRGGDDDDRVQTRLFVDSSGEAIGASLMQEEKELREMHPGKDDVVDRLGVEGTSGIQPSCSISRIWVQVLFVFELNSNSRLKAEQVKNKRVARSEINGRFGEVSPRAARFMNFNFVPALRMSMWTSLDRVAKLVAAIKPRAPDCQVCEPVQRRSASRSGSRMYLTFQQSASRSAAVRFRKIPKLIEIQNRTHTGRPSEHSSPFNTRLRAGPTTLPAGRVPIWELLRTVVD